MEKDYSAYSIDDFLADEDFLHWVFEPNQELNEFWRTWMLDHDDSVVIEAKMWALLIRENCLSYSISDEEIERIWEGVQKLAFKENQK
jgi:hypothetical protein